MRWSVARAAFSRARPWCSRASLSVCSIRAMTRLPSHGSQRRCRDSRWSVPFDATEAKRYANIAAGCKGRGVRILLQLGWTTPVSTSCIGSNDRARRHRIDGPRPTARVPSIQRHPAQVRRGALPAASATGKDQHRVAGGVSGRFCVEVVQSKRVRCACLARKARGESPVIRLKKWLNEN